MQAMGSTSITMSATACRARSATNADVPIPNVRARESEPIGSAGSRRVLSTSLSMLLHQKVQGHIFTKSYTEKSKLSPA